MTREDRRGLLGESVRKAERAGREGRSDLTG